MKTKHLFQSNFNPKFTHLPIFIFTIFYLSSLVTFAQIDTTKNTYDTLVFYYTRSLHFVSVACGYTYYYNLNKITATYHDLDSVAIKDPSINDNATIEHVKLYY